jgi:DNA adenine methylase
MKNVITYFGGKNSQPVLNRIFAQFPQKNSYKTYAEAYGGSAGVLLNKECDPVEIYNDLDSNVFSLYKVIQDPDLKEKFREKCDLAIYHESFRNEYKKLLKTELSILDRAFYFWFINRTSSRGMGTNGFKVIRETRFRMSTSITQFLKSIETLTEIHQRLSRVIFYSRPALEIIDKFRKDSDNFLYLDPPYLPETRCRKRYSIDMETSDHESLVEVLTGSDFKAKVLLSGYPNFLYKKLERSGFIKNSFHLPVLSGNFKESKISEECLWQNYEEKQMNLFSAGGG